MSTARMSQPGSLPRDPLLGARIDGRYRIRSVHGRGGMGIVYAAVHEDLRRDVAVKVLDKSWASDRNAIDRFLQEARTASGLSHGNIVDVLDLGRLPDGRPYLVMPLIIGSDLATVLAEEGPQHPKRVATLLTGVASALDLIHAKGLVHHDIKPENLMRVRREDGSETVVVLDFGIAGVRFPTDGRAMELFDRGTPEFMPPEAASGAVPDRRGDIYALATVAFELMTGRLPFDSNDDAELATLKATRPPSSMTYASGNSFPLALEAVVARGLATRPAERYPTAGEFVRRLAHVASQIADDFMTRAEARSAGGPVLQAPARPQRKAVASRSRTLMAAAGLARPSSPVPAGTTAASASAEPQEAVSSTASTLPQMHAVEVASPQYDAAPDPGAGEVSGARALPRAPDPEPSRGRTPTQPSRKSKTPVVSPTATTSASPSPTEAKPTVMKEATGSAEPAAEATVAAGAESTTASNAALAFERAAASAPLTASQPPPARERPPAAERVHAKPSLPSEDDTTESSGTFLRKLSSRDTVRSSRSPRSSASASEPGTRNSVAPPISAPPAAAEPAPAAVTAPELPILDQIIVVAEDDDSVPLPDPLEPTAGGGAKVTSPMFGSPDSWTPGPYTIPSASAAAPAAEPIVVRVPLAAPGELDDESDVMDDAALAAEFRVGDERATVPSEYRRRRSVLLHPALLAVFGAALLFWLYAVLPERDLTSEELPSATHGAATPPVMPHSTPTRTPAAAPEPAPSAEPAAVLAAAPAEAAAQVAQPDVPAAEPAVQPLAGEPAAEQPAAEPTAEPSALTPAETRAARRAARAAARAAATAKDDTAITDAPAAPAPPARPRRAASDRPASASAKPAADGRTPPELVRQAEDALMSGQLANAADLYQKAITADSSYAPAYRGKGLVMERLGRNREAADAFRTFLRLSPGSPAAAKIREHLETLSE